ncbi:conserved exported hypothetical protein [Cupriavidus taiwanensis]|uniref:Extra-cytoplasmic solute receptor n=1 Tax=Cupriavidus taiwanensis TaxID=164546 RepID=A0A375FIW7_9BURK|nr:tripartite tricarboxylate transporter substrate binding protein [Cupriavidus taiwanensis]SOZ73176.1 conserved exported hypothetical protein [Cupriavidus taiwanensis]SOZ73664.1 conserved exported hypothetical protein [Cupriavidus taiwanensis]SOZ75298.1 conserved exported hypothetical protein [Cupriavidus taiwanensis]SPA03777.1 conserved exported hypothetical protein [Cupriavidus taiwanensis]SPA12604.1 conserved exported hypothetical protein [Cupriavidus taiwanensis]
MTSKTWTRRHFLGAISSAPFAGTAGASFLGFSPSVNAADAAWPTKPVRLMVGFPPGGGADAIARLVGRKLEVELGQPFVIDNKNGATGTICSAEVARSAPDGYTLQAAHVSSNAIAPMLLAKGRFDPIKDFTPIGLIGITPHVLAVNSKSHLQSLDQLIKYAKANPGKLTFMSAGVGSSPQLAGEEFKRKAGIDMLHVPFKGTGEALNALLANEVDMTFSSTGSVMQHVKTGRLKVLAVCSPKRLASMPNLPAIAEVLPGYEAYTWYGLAGPAGLPTHVVAKLEKAMQKIVQQPDFVKRMADLDAEVKPMTAAQFNDFWRTEVTKYQALIKLAKLG